MQTADKNLKQIYTYYRRQRYFQKITNYVRHTATITSISFKDHKTLIKAEQATTHDALGSFLDKPI
jgi:hypothetical protein